MIESEAGTRIPSHYTNKLPLLTLPFLTSFLLVRGRPSISTGSFLCGSPMMTSGMLTAHTRWAHRPVSVGFSAPPRSKHRQHSFEGRGERGSTINNDSSMELVGLVANG